MGSKKGLSNKDANRMISEGLDNGESKNEIFDRLSAEYYDSNKIAKLIASFPDKDLKEKYKGLNQGLFVLLVVTAILKVVSTLPILLEGPAIGLVMILIVPILNIYFALEVKKTRGYVYKILGLLAIAGIFQSFRGIGEAGMWVLVDVVILGVISGLSFYVGSKMFPNYGFSGPKKDASGNWLL